MFLYAVWPVIVAGVAVIMDIRSARVDNGWIVFSLCVSLYLTIWREGIWAVPIFFVGSLLPLIILGILFYFRMLGPGDIKLFCVLGGCMGFPSIIWCIIVSFLIGAVISLSILIFYGMFSQRIRYFYEYLQDYLRTGRWKPYYKRGMPLENIHFTVPVFLSVMLYAGGVY